MNPLFTHTFHLQLNPPSVPSSSRLSIKSQSNQSLKNFATLFPNLPPLFSPMTLLPGLTFFRFFFSGLLHLTLGFRKFLYLCSLNWLIISVKPYFLNCPPFTLFSSAASVLPPLPMSVSLPLPLVSTSFSASPIPPTATGFRICFPS